MRYYQYISDAKVDMLLPQIPLAIKQKVSGELGVDLKFFNAKLKTEHSTLEDRIKRLQMVEAYVVKTELIGGIEDMAPWVRGVVDVEAGYFPGDKKIVGYFGKIENIDFLLAGSSGHIIGSDPKDAEIGFGFSFLPRLANSLEHSLEQFEKWDRAGADDNRIIGRLMGKDDTKEDNWYKFVRDRPSSPESRMKVEFLARRLLANPDRRVFIGTPLFVASAD